MNVVQSGSGAGYPSISLCCVFLLQSPVSAKKEKKVSCMFIPDGHVSVSARIDRKGFCEGEILEHGNFSAFLPPPGNYICKKFSSPIGGGADKNSTEVFF